MRRRFLDEGSFDHNQTKQIVESGKMSEAIENELLQMLKLKVWIPLNLRKSTQSTITK